MNTAKLIASKTEWARTGRLLVPQPRERRRLPPGQTLTRDFPVLDLGTQPNLNPRDWSLTIGGRVARPGRYSLDDLTRIGLTEATSDIHCVTAWSRYDNLWRGVSTRRIAVAGEGARYAILKSYDGYATCVTVEDFFAEGAMIATHWDDKPLTREHGGPVRLVIPHLYFWKSPKWLRQIWFTDLPLVGYWEARGYHKRGDPWTQQRYE